MKSTILILMLFLIIGCKKEHISKEPIFYEVTFENGSKDTLKLRGHVGMGDIGKGFKLYDGQTLVATQVLYFREL